MTGHFILCKISTSFDQSVQTLQTQFGKIHYEQWNSMQGRVAIMLDESYFFRSNSTSAILVVIKEIGVSETNIEIVSCAGDSGLAGFSWGAESAYGHDVLKNLRKSGFEVEVLKEISYYDSSMRLS